MERILLLRIPSYPQQFPQHQGQRCQSHLQTLHWRYYRQQRNDHLKTTHSPKTYRRSLVGGEGSGPYHLQGYPPEQVQEPVPVRRLHQRRPQHQNYRTLHQWNLQAWRLAQHLENRADRAGWVTSFQRFILPKIFASFIACWRSDQDWCSDFIHNKIWASSLRLKHV